MPGTKAFESRSASSERRLGISMRKRKASFPSSAVFFSGLRMPKATSPAPSRPDNNLPWQPASWVVSAPPDNRNRRPSMRRAKRQPVPPRQLSLYSTKQISSHDSSQIPATHSHYEHSRQHPAGQDAVEKLVDCHRRSSHRPKVHHSLRAVSGLNSIPTGFCIHAFATRIHQAEIVAPSPVSQVEAR